MSLKLVSFPSCDSLLEFKDVAIHQGTRNWGRRPGINEIPRSPAHGENAVISLLVGVAFGPNGANIIRPRDYAECNHEGVSVIECRDNLNAITLNFSRLVLGVQLVLAGVQLPSKYLKKEWKSDLLLVGPGMTAMWITTSLLIWAFARTPSFLHALAIGACVTPTDPVLSAVIVKGKFADHNIPKDLQNLIIAESIPWI
jgi:NhaP-type Na+/H+ or K+/H+ antiporter